MRSRIRIHFDRSDFTAFISKVIEVSLPQIRKMRRAYIVIDTITASVGERSSKLSDYHAEQLIEYLHQRLTVYQDEMIWFLFDEFSIVIDQSTVFRLLVTRKWSKKLVKRTTAQRSEILREKWKLRLTDWTADQLMFLNESAACERTDKSRSTLEASLMLIHWLNDRKYDWASVKVSLHVSQMLKRSKRWSILSTYTIEKYMTWEMHHDFIIKTIFLDFMWIRVLSQCTSDDSESRFVIIMNNARIHQSVELDQLCMKFEVLLIKLSSYSSDFNLIEIFFAVLKIWIKKNIDLIQYYTKSRDEFDEFLRDAVRSQRSQIEDDSDNLFRLADIDYNS